MNLNPKAILFTAKVLQAASDDHDDLLKVTHVVEEGFSSWPRFYLDCGNYSWLSRVNFTQAYAISGEFEQRASWLARQFLQENLTLRSSVDSAPAITQDLALDLAKQIVSVFHQSPLCSQSGDANYYLAMRRCAYAGSLQRIDGQKPYVLTSDEQLQEWLAGRPMHNYLRNECCPDFSCCQPDALVSQTLRQKFVDSNDSQRLAILSMFLSGTESNFYLPVVNGDDTCH